MHAYAFLFVLAAASLPHYAAGVSLERLVVDEELEPAPPHARFTSMLAQAREQLVGASAVEAQQQQQRPAPGAADGKEGSAAGGEGADETTRQRAVAQMLPSALTALSDGIAKLQDVHTEVSKSSLPTEIKAQVLWDLKKMMTDSQRLRATSLAAPARDALVKALQVRAASPAA